MRATLTENEPKSHAVARTLRDRASVLLVCRIVCIALALAEAWSQRRFLNEDGVSYLDMSDVLLRHNWHLLVNPIWSPLYPFLIGIATWFARPSAQWEVPLVHLVNFLIFVGAMASFEFLLRQVILVLRPAGTASGRNHPAALPVRTWQLLAYGLFAWSTFGMMWAPRMVTPDLSVAAFVYLDCALILKLRAGAARIRICLLLGLVLGLGYYAKAILFPMALVFLLVALFAMGARRKPLLPVAVAFLVFCAVSAPLVIAMSARVGKLSYSEVGNLNYAWHVNYVGGGKLAGGPFFPAASGAPEYLRHPLNLFYPHPEVYGFTEPLKLTYPPRSDMAYWGAGTKVVFNLRNQAAAILGGLKLFFTDAHILPLTTLILAGLILVFARPLEPRGLAVVLPSWPLLIPGVIGPCLYLLISVEPRYLAPFFVLILFGLFPGVLRSQAADAAGKRTLWPAAVTATLMLMAALLVGYNVAGYPRQESGSQFLEIGTSLNRAGVRPGEQVGIIGDSSDACRWARLARVHVVAQILREDVPDYWRIADPHKLAAIDDAFVRAGAAAVVAEMPPPTASLAGWQKLGSTNYYVHFPENPQQVSSLSR